MGECSRRAGILLTASHGKGDSRWHSRLINPVRGRLGSGAQPYILANIGVVKYYLTEGRSQFNPVLHILVPVMIATAAGIVAVGKSCFSPFTSSGVVFWGLMVFIALLVVSIAAPIYMRARRQEEWMVKVQLVFEQS